MINCQAIFPSGIKIDYQGEMVDIQTVRVDIGTEHPKGPEYFKIMGIQYEAIETDEPGVYTVDMDFPIW